MRIWDINPRFLNHQSLLGEHRELHGIISILVNDKKGYSKHPETLRWVSFHWALKKRHQLLSAKMSLRNFTDKSPVLIQKNKGLWAKNYIDEPAKQFMILNKKYQNKEQGRITLPKNAQQLGGACDLEFHANTCEEMAELSQKHGMEMHQIQDAAHLKAMEKWQEEKRKEFDALPED